MDEGRSAVLGRWSALRRDVRPAAALEGEDEGGARPGARLRHVFLDVCRALHEFHRLPPARWCVHEVSRPPHGEIRHETSVDVGRYLCRWFFLLSLGDDASALRDWLCDGRRWRLGSQPHLEHLRIRRGHDTSEPPMRDALLRRDNLGHRALRALGMRLLPTAYLMVVFCIVSFACSSLHRLHSKASLLPACCTARTVVRKFAEE
mmetsp:Transcript_4629/g.17407  ORF Transcript_4629/g.17407 Transcript_4629/m.17407 type:complete len:205 (-) Transcript_4629:32-646(-)